MKMRIDLDEMSQEEWIEYVEICGWALARGHARTGDAAKIAGYLGKNAKFDEAIEEFSIAYADQADRDYEVLVKAIRAGRLPARSYAAA